MSITLIDVTNQSCFDHQSLQKIGIVMSRDLKKTFSKTAATLLAFLSLCAHAQTDMFLQFEGPGSSALGGESPITRYKDAIDVLAWTWNLANTGTTHVPGGGAGKSFFADISLTKFIDTSSVELLKRATDGTIIDSARLTMAKPGGVGPGGQGVIENQQIVMSNVLVSSVSTGGSGGEDRLTENVTLNFASFCIGYQARETDGSTGEKYEFCWNIAANAVCSREQLENLLKMPLADELPLRQLLALGPSCPVSGSQDAHG